MIRLALLLLAFVVSGIVSCSIAHGQALDFKVDGPAEIAQGEYVELTVLFPEGVKADVDFVPVEETDFGVHPVVVENLEDGKLVASVIGRKCTFSARCLGEREIVVVATAFANFDGVPRIKSIKHRIRVKAGEAPKPPPEPPKPDPPKQPPDDDGGDDDLGPEVPFPTGSVGKSDVEKITLILDNVITRLEAIEKRTLQVSAPAPAKGAGQPAAVPAPVAVAKPAPTVVAKPTIVDANPGHWSVASARNEWSPTKAETIAHLRQSHPSKARQHEPLESLSHEELRTLHDDDHEGRSTRTTTTFVSASAASACPGGVCPTYSQPVVRYAEPMGSACPGGVCPTYSPSRSYGRTLFRWGR